MGGVVKGIGKALFGHDDERKIAYQQVPTLTPAQRRFLDKLANYLSGQIGKGVPAYPGELVEPLTPLQRTLLGVYSGEVGPLSGLFRRGLQEVQTMTPYNPELERQYWQEAFVRPAERRFWTRVVPSLAETFAGRNALSSSGFNRALAEAAADMETSLGSKLADIIWQGQARHYEEEMGKRRMGLAMMEDALSRLSDLMSLAEIERQVGQAQKEAEYKKWLSSRPWSNPWLSPSLAAVALKSPYETYAFAKGSPPSGGLLGSVMGGLGTSLGAGLGGKILGAIF